MIEPKPTALEIFNRMIARAHDRFRDDKTMTVERCANELFEEFREITHVSDENLRAMCLNRAGQVAYIISCPVAPTNPPCPECGNLCRSTASDPMYFHCHVCGISVSKSPEGCLCFTVTERPLKIEDMKFMQEAYEWAKSS